MKEEKTFEDNLKELEEIANNLESGNLNLDEAIKEFEKDISEGKNVKLENYIKTEKIDYSNMISDTGYNVGILIEKFMNKGIKKTVKILSSLFLD